MDERQYNVKFLLAMGMLVNAFEYIERSLISSVELLEELSREEVHKQSSDQVKSCMCYLLRTGADVRNGRIDAAVNSKLMFREMLAEIAKNDPEFISSAYNDLLDLSLDKKLKDYEQAAITYCLYELRLLSN